MTIPTAATSEAAPAEATRSWWYSKWRLWQGLSPRYGLIILGGSLLMFAGSNRVTGATNGIVKPQEILVMLAALAGLSSLIAAGAYFSAPRSWYRVYSWMRYPLYAVGLLLALGTLLTFAGTLELAVQPAAQVYENDVLAFTHVNAKLVLAGRNPYTSNSAFADALRQFPEGYPSPLRGGILGTGDDPPSFAEIKAIRKLYLADPQAARGALDPRTLHSYPALSFLLYVPFFWAGLPNILWLNVLVCWGVLIWIAWQAPRSWRAGALFVAGTGVCILYSLPVDTEIICIALLLVAWHLRNRKWWGPVLLGLACAFKQYCWLFLPLFILEIWLTQGRRAALRWLGVTLVAFLLPNLPFLISSPAAWTQSLFLPVTEPLFPQGIGIMALSLGHILPYGPTLLYSALEVVALGAMLWLQVRYHRQLGDAVLILALVPLFFAFRSPPNYFAFAPWLALYAVNCIYVSRDGLKTVGTKKVMGLS